MSETGFLRRTIARLATSTSDLEAAELRDEAQANGCRPMTTYKDRDLVTLHGSLTAVTLRPHGGVCTLEAELDDGSGAVTILWLGQRRIAGIAPGRAIKVSGRLSCLEGRRVMYNPRYELTA
jgi:hypothetical protein